MAFSAKTRGLVAALALGALGAVATRAQDGGPPVVTPQTPGAVVEIPPGANAVMPPGAIGEMPPGAIGEMPPGADLEVLSPEGAGLGAPPGEAAGEGVEPVIPVAYGLYRYEPIWSKSPFMLETPLATTVADSFSKDLAITSVTVIDGKTRVGLVNTKTRETQTATTEAANDKGIRVLKVVPHADPSKVEVELEGANAEKSKVAFDTLTLQGKPSVPNPAPALVRPPGGEAVSGAPGQPVQLIPGRPPTGGPSSTSPTRRRIVLPNSIAKPSNTPPQPQEAPAPPVFLQTTTDQPVQNQ